MTGDPSAVLQGLLARLAAGDQAARHELIGCAYQRLRCLARVILNESFPRLKKAPVLLDTTDLANEAAVKLYQALEGWVALAALEFHFQQRLIAELNLTEASQEQLQREMRGFAPALLADASETATAQIDAIDRDVRPWWDALSPAERERTNVVVLGAKTPRVGNLAYTYFVNLLGGAEDGHRVVYAESVSDEKGADAILATLLTDRRLSVDFFADERRMERDLLADGAEARVLQLFGRLGVP